MIVVADTSPINYLAQIELVHLLPELYGEIVITPSVLRELSHLHAPFAVKRLLAQWPDWLLVRSPSPQPQNFLPSLDDGEREAIQYSEECRADLLIIDERRGWAIAGSRGLTRIGTLGILLQAGRQRLTNPIDGYFHLTSQTNFRLSAAQRSEFVRNAPLLDGQT